MDKENNRMQERGMRSIPEGRQPGRDAKNSAEQLGTVHRTGQMTVAVVTTKGDD